MMPESTKGPPGPIANISDTARWVAMYRAWESERPDAIFHDPYARRLAGARGEEIVRTLPGAKEMAWAMIVRTAVIDEMVLTLVARQQVDVILLLAAGLDARAYRLPLPPTLQMVEVDLPEMIAYKERELAGEHPACRLTREAVDLADESARRALFTRVGAMGKHVLVITEGLLTYLYPEQVAALARDLRAQSAFRWWLVDFTSPRILQYMKRRVGRELDAANATMHFAPVEGPEFFRPFGWRPIEVRSFVDEAYRLKREMRFAWLWRLLTKLSSPKRRERIRKEYLSGLALLEAVEPAQ